MSEFGGKAASIFVSHASKDITNVRLIRNYLEERGASPILFHLMGMPEPEQFWPVIVQEIRARSFFLYCDSDAAEASEWVRREREVVKQESKTAPKRIGRMRVDEPELDYPALDRFLTLSRAVIFYADVDAELVRPYIEALTARGFQVIDSERGSAQAVEDNSGAPKEGIMLLFSRHEPVIGLLDPLWREMQRQPRWLAIGIRLVEDDALSDIASPRFPRFNAFAHGPDAPAVLCDHLFTLQDDDGIPVTPLLVGRQGMPVSVPQPIKVAILSRSPETGCLSCRGSGWVCDVHRDRPPVVASGHETACTCGGAPTPCRSCYPESRILDEYTSPVVV